MYFISHREEGRSFNSCRSSMTFNTARNEINAVDRAADFCLNAVYQVSTNSLVSSVRYLGRFASCSQVKVLIFILFCESLTFPKVGNLNCLAMNQFRSVGFVLIRSRVRKLSQATF